MSKTTQDIIKLNVGGMIIHTLKSTLLKRNTFFHEFLKGDTICDDQGNLFLDRSPDDFKVILRYLRDGVCPEDPSMDQIREFEFYGIKIPLKRNNFTHYYDYSDVPETITPDNFLIEVEKVIGFIQYNKNMMAIFKDFMFGEKIVHHYVHANQQDFSCCAITNYCSVYMIGSEDTTKYILNIGKIINPYDTLVCGYGKPTQALVCKGRSWIDPKYFPMFRHIAPYSQFAKFLSLMTGNDDLKFY
jgi:hypothetical protein